MLEFSEYLSLGDAIFITVVSITIVFAILALIAVIISSFTYIFKEEQATKAKSKSQTKTVPVADTKVVNKVNLDDVAKDENMMAALLVASIEANKNDENIKYRVASIKEI